jgi:hypothetical protein
MRDYSNGRECVECGRHQPPEAFYWKDAKTRLSSRCRSCKSAHYKENPHRAKERAAAWYAANRDRALARDRAYRRESISRVLLSAARSRAKRLGLPFDLTEKDIVVPDVCPVLGIPLAVQEGRSTPNSPSLDRIIPSLGYVRGNVVVVSHRANTIKSDACVEELRRVLDFYESLNSHGSAGDDEAGSPA